LKCPRTNKTASKGGYYDSDKFIQSKDSLILPPVGSAFESHKRTAPM
jgi:hypothetical protein